MDDVIVRLDKVKANVFIIGEKQPHTDIRNDPRLQNSSITYIQMEDAQNGRSEV